MLLPINPDFNSSVSMTNFTMEELYPLELTSDRLTALMTLPKGVGVSIDTIHSKLHNSLPCKGVLASQEKVALELKPWLGIEILILEGSCKLNKDTCSQGCYLRLPNTQGHTITAASNCIIFIKYNQFLSGDTGDRTIDTRNADKWLPGPVEGIEIRPLHVFDTESIMLLRWQHAAEFKPNLNPRGEEILVVNGLLQTRDQIYRQFSWIRNPIEDWRSWHGNTGTLAYYKSGHFPDDPIRNNS